MATLSTIHPTLLDVAKAKDPNGQIGKVVEILSETNEVLDDMVFIEGNLPTGHRSIIRTGLPVPTWRKLYGGVQPTKGTTAQVTDNCGSLEAYAEIDKALADLSNNAAAYRMIQDRAHIEGMNIEMADTLFYGSEGTEPEAFTGLTPRFNSTTPANADNIILGGGSGADNSSVWLVVWGEGKCHGIYPQGSKAGISVADKGQVTIEDVDGSGGRMEAYRTHYRWDMGMVVADWRYVVRIANIDNSDLTKNAASGADLVDLMTQALELVPSLSGGRPAFYCNRTVKSFLRRQIKNSNNVQITMGEVAGKRVTMFDEVPVRRCDALHSAEALVS